MALGDYNSDQLDKAMRPDPEDPPAIQVAPGEPVPPGFEGTVEKIAVIQVQTLWKLM